MTCRYCGRTLYGEALDPCSCMDEDRPYCRICRSRDCQCVEIEEKIEKRRGK